MVTLLALVALQSPRVETFEVEGLKRQALVYTPSKDAPGAPPLVFGFHGHGGNMRQAARSFRMHEEMPEAVVVYMQGIPTATPNDPEGKRNGWQVRKGAYEDRDLKFFDSVYAWALGELGADKARVYSMGHSNGGRFTYLLWQERGGAFAAFGPSGSPAFLAALPPKPFFHVAGEQDRVVSFAHQRLTVERQMKANGCEARPYRTDGHAKYYRGNGGNEAATYFHPGGHEYPREAPRLLAAFFRAH